MVQIGDSLYGSYIGPIRLFLTYLAVQTRCHVHFYTKLYYIKLNLNLINLKLLYFQLYD